MKVIKIIFRYTTIQGENRQLLELILKIFTQAAYKYYVADVTCNEMLLFRIVKRFHIRIPYFPEANAR